ncbi:MAG: TrbG/VirB9 family P-type conjugative transfer protein [Alphaproteobacteria bacterium]|nr:TrbG/VirB9 family P-type conjugative transfer protein [Alphaproteobacteria bacterium]
MRKLKYGSMALLLGVVLGVQAGQHAIPERSDDPRMRYIDFVPKSVTSINVYQGFLVHLVFSQGEKVRRFHTGLGRGYFIRTTDNGIMLRPNGRQPSTNLVVQTNQNTYYFDLVPDTPAPDLALEHRHLNPRLVYRIGLREHQQVQAAWLQEQADRALALAAAQPDWVQAPVMPSSGNGVLAPQLADAEAMR